MRKTQRGDSISCADVLNLASCSIANLELVKRFTVLFEAYIDGLETERRRENIHCANLTLTLSMRKRHIEVEHEKYCQQVCDLVSYFVQCTEAVSKQLEHRFLLQFLTSGAHD